MQKARLLLGLFLLAGSVQGQGIPYFSNVFTSANSAPPGSQTTMFTVPFSTVTVCGAIPVGNPCTNTVVIYANAAMSVTAHNPITTDVHGKFNFWAPAGTYSYSLKSASGTLLGTYYFTLGGSGGGSSISLQHNGTAVANQNVLNFNDTTPAAPAGNVNVVFGSDSTGKLSAWVPIGGSSFSLTTTGTSGPATYASSVLNIPDYTYTLTVPKITALGVLTNDISGSSAKIGGVAVSGVPGIGQAIVALSSSTASWQTLSALGGISGQTPNCVLKANSATTSNASAPICDNGTTTTITHPVAIADSTHPSQISLTYTAGHAPVPAAGSAVYAADTSGNAQVSENGAAVSRLCTAANGVCAVSSGFPVVLGSTSIAASSTTTTIAGLTLTAPTFTTPALGTPASGVLTNTTGLPLSTGVTGNLPNTNLASQTANTVLGALTATTPSGLAVPSCSGASSALTWTTGTGFGCNTITGGGTGNTTSTSLTTNSLPKANGANSIINSLFTDNGTGGAYTGTGGFSAAAFLGTGSDHYLNIPSSPSHTPATSDLYNNAGTLIWCPSGTCANLYPLALSSLASQAADTVVQNASGSSAAPTAVAVPNCATALIYSTSTHTWGCASASTGFSPYPTALTAPVSTNFTWVNPGSETTFDKTGRLVVTLPSNSAVNGRFLVSNASIPAAPYTITACGMFTGQSSGGNGQMMGVAVMNSSNDAVTFSPFVQVANPPVGLLFRSKWTSTGTVTSNTTSVAMNTWGSQFNCSRITDDGTNRKFYYSNNGQDFRLYASEATNTDVTPTKFALFFYNNAGTFTTTEIYTVYHWDVATSILPQIGN